MLDFVAHPLVEPSWLAAHLADDDVRVVDARWRGDRNLSSVGMQRARYLYSSLCLGALTSLLQGVDGRKDRAGDLVAAAQQPVGEGQ